MSLELEQRLPEAGHAATLHSDKGLVALATQPLCFQRAGMTDSVHRHENGMRGLDQGLERTNACLCFPAIMTDKVGTLFLNKVLNAKFGSRPSTDIQQLHAFNGRIHSRLVRCWVGFEPTFIGLDQLAKIGNRFVPDFQNVSRCGEVAVPVAQRLTQGAVLQIQLLQLRF